MRLPWVASKEPNGTWRRNLAEVLRKRLNLAKDFGNVEDYVRRWREDLAARRP